MAEGTLITGKMCRFFFWYIFVHMPNTAVLPSQGNSIWTQKVVNIRLSPYCDLIMTACSKLQKRKDREKLRNHVCYLHVLVLQYVNFGNGGGISARSQPILTLFSHSNRQWLSRTQNKSLKCKGGNYSDRKDLLKYLAIWFNLLNLLS
jgi:hypothetical protein